MKPAYLERLKQGVLLFDSAMGTMLYDRGIYINRCFEEANLSRPELVERIHRENAEAGAEALTTNTFGGNAVRLTAHGLGESVVEINRAGVRLARDVAGEDLYVAGSVGPLGVRIAPLGPLQRKDAEHAFSEQIGALLAQGVDLLIFETFKNLDELLIAVGAARKLDRSVPIQAQMSIGPFLTEEYRREAPAAAKRLDRKDGVDVIGFNCTLGPSDMLDILLSIRGHVHKPIAIMPNAGFPREVEGRQIYLTTPDYFAEYAQKFFEGGAAIIGGCCGTTPEHIRKMGRAILTFGKAQAAVETRKPADEPHGKDPIALAERSRLGRMLANGEWITSVELVPPLGADLSKLIERGKELARAGVGCVNVPDGPRASSRTSALISAIELQRHAGVEAILHFACRDKNLIAIQADLLAGEAVGLKNMLLITGDPPKVGNYPDVTGVFDVDSIGLLHLANRLNHGIDLGGSALAAPTSLVLGAGTNPASPVLDREVDRAYRKAEAGAEFFITQPVFDADGLLAFLRRIEGTGVPVIAGVWPLASYRNAQFLHNEVPGVVIPEVIMTRMSKQESKEDAREEGIRIAREIIERIRGAVRGVQVSPPFGRIRTALDVIA
jgi:methionine synthase / methylenetetrahydrofolate reductase (NADH)